MHHSLLTLALALVFSLDIAAEPIAFRRRDHVSRNDAPPASRNATHTLEKRFSGCRFTWYDTGLGACGKVNHAYESVVALNQDQWAGGAHCGQTITLSFGGKSKTATIVDLCPGCSACALDLSESLFQFFADTGVGVLSGSWNFGSGGSGSSQPQQRPAPPPPPTTTQRTNPTPATTTGRSKPSPTTPTKIPSTSLSTSTSTPDATSSATPLQAAKEVASSSSTTPTLTTTSTSAITLPSNLPGGTDVMNLINLAILSLGKLIVSTAENNLNA